MQQKRRISPTRKLARRKTLSRCERAYNFFARSEQNHRIFSDLDIRRHSGYALGTIATYHTKKWAWFLKEQEPGRWYCDGLFTHTKEAFIELHKQTRSPTTPEVVIQTIEAVKEVRVVEPIVIDEKIWIVALLALVMRLLE